ncbi:VWA domain-containing protein [Stutzerimonas azotifigens]|uniref:VWA domain-containing protein n=1 Tax=Stutzerimonas azotifigens TaxID=291995 RepID=UPI00040408D7|nr:VWA domain-containing protein [Stutzerimonas azotifigens]
MSALLPHLLRPWWLLLLPLLGWLLWRLWHRQRRVGRWQLLLPPAFQAVLLTRGRLRNSRLPWVLLGVAWLLACLALVGPSWERIEQSTFKRADPLVVLLEVTPAMLAGDASPTRLEQAKRKLLDLLAAREDAQTAVVVFAGSAHTLVPLSDDIGTTRNLLDAVSPAIMPEAGRRTELAVAQGLALLEQGGQGQGRLLLIGTGLDEHAQAQIRLQLADRGERLAILGVGTAEGAPVLAEDGSLMKDERGAIFIPRLDSQGLRAFAAELGGRYQAARLDDADLANLGLLENTGGARRTNERTRLDTWFDQGHWLLLPLLLLAASAGRKGWLFCLLPLLMLPPRPAYALEWDDLWLRPDQQGQRLLRQQRPEEAAQRFADPLWRGLARYLAGDYQGAAEDFARGQGAIDHYNRGNALARSGALDEALEAYDLALDLDPGLDQARHNRALVEQLRQQQARQPSEPDQQTGETPPAEQGSQPAQQPGQPAAGGAPEAPAPAGETEAARSPQGPAAPIEPDSPAQNEDDLAIAPQAGEDDDPDADGAPRSAEDRQATEQWLRRIPDDPGELLRRKFLYEQRKRQETRP